MSPDQLARLPLKELKVLATAKGVARVSRMRKDELIDALCAKLGQRREPPPPATPPTASAQPAPRAWTPPPAEHGLPIPEHYGRTRVVLLAQDPQHVFAYWEVTPEALARARTAIGEDGRPVLVLVTDGGDEQREIDLAGGSYYLAVAPGRTYRVRLALRDSRGRLQVIAESNAVQTPPAGPSPRTDETWIAVDEAMERVLAADPQGTSGSGARLRQRRVLNPRRVDVDESEAGAALPPAAYGGPGPSSIDLQRPWGAGVSSIEALPSSGSLLSSHAVGSSHLLSSRARSSGSLFGHDTSESPYPIDATFAVPPTGLPKQAEGLPTGPVPPVAAPTVTTAPVTAKPRDELAFVGAPKPRGKKRLPTSK